jgi:predicted transcriptional regulator
MSQTYGRKSAYCAASADSKKCNLHQPTRPENPSIISAVQGKIMPDRISSEFQTTDQTTTAKTARDNTASAKGFALYLIGELLARPEVPPDYLVDNLLVRGTVSCVVAKPKVGKSTFARGLCLSVSRGTPFLGKPARQGACIYLALEERHEEITADFRAMGATGTETIMVHADAAPVSAIISLVELVRKEHPALVVIDPLFRLAHVRDEKAYAEVYAALGPLIDVARETGTHILVTHHAGKSIKADATDSPLGSTAIAGAAATLIVLNKRESGRTIQTVTRIGAVIPETMLSFDTETKRLSLGATRTDVARSDVEEEILDFLKVAGERTEPEIDDCVTGTNSIKRTALRTLVERGLVDRKGTGTRGDAFKYSFACTESVMRTSVQETEKQSQASIEPIGYVEPGEGGNSLLTP